MRIFRWRGVIVVPGRNPCRKEENIIMENEPRLTQDILAVGNNAGHLTTAQNINTVFIKH